MSPVARRRVLRGVQVLGRAGIRAVRRVPALLVSAFELVFATFLDRDRRRRL
jgi:hypothetical protein